MKYLFHIAFKGTDFKGWQRQAEVVTVQSCIEDTISMVLKEKISIHGCGRTDKGVHASQYFFHAEIFDSKINQDSLRVLNKNLPDAIRLFNIREVSSKFNAQHSATARTYRYYFHTYNDPFLADISNYIEGSLDKSEMKKAIDLIAQNFNYKAFCYSPEKYDHTICNISGASINYSSNQKQFYIEITSDRFLRGMMRILCGNILRIGKQKIDLPEFQNSLEKGNRPKYLNSASPQGLYLSKVSYEEFYYDRLASEPSFPGFDRYGKIPF